MWYRGQHLRGKLIESPSENYWIVSIEGKLIGVNNRTPHQLQTNQWVDLEVKTEKPLEFSIIGQTQKTNRQIQIRI